MPLQTIHTACAGCCFAIKEGKTQRGCALGLLEQHKAKGAEMLEAFDEVNNEFFIINGRLCLAKRSEAWRKGKPEHVNLLKATIRKEMEPKIYYIVYADTKDPQGLDTTIDSINAQEILPDSVVFINNTESEPLAIMNGWNRLKNGITRSVRNIYEESANRDRCVDMTMKGCKTRYFLVCDVGEKIPEDLSHKLDCLINDEMEKVMLVEFGKNGYLSQSFWFRQMYGNSGMNYVDKVKDTLKEHEFGNVHYRW